MCTWRPRAAPQAESSLEETQDLIVPPGLLKGNLQAVQVFWIVGFVCLNFYLTKARFLLALAMSCTAKAFASFLGPWHVHSCPCACPSPFAAKMQAHVWNPSLCSLLCPGQTLAVCTLQGWLGEKVPGRNVVKAKRLALTSSQGGFSCQGCFSLALWTATETTTAPPGMSVWDPVVAAAGRGSGIDL